MNRTALSVLALLTSVGCSPMADAAPRGTSALTTTSASPYTVQLLSDSGATLTTYNHRGRFYILGDHGGRYSIRIQNPTSHRVEALVTVDGLDVIDGRAGSFGKRGYVIPPYGTIDIDGFRQSQNHVAAFRFSSVANSYAGRKGVARNVGVVGVAFFQEKYTAPLHRPQPIPRPNRRWFEPGPSKAEANERSSADSAGAGPRPRSSAKSSAKSSVSRSSPGIVGGGRAAEISPPTWQRPGLGTQYGETRHSAVQWTQFVRGSSAPTAVATLRYNDRSGLLALGIQLSPQPNHNEIYWRETANPFPSSGFATPPPAWR